MSEKRIMGENSPAMDLLMTNIAKQKAESKPTKKKAPAKKEKPQTATEEDKKETRSRRVQLVIEPSLYERLNDTAWNSRQSVNATIIQAITEYLERRK